MTATRSRVAAQARTWTQLETARTSLSAVLRGLGTRSYLEKRNRRSRSGSRSGLRAVTLSDWLRRSAPSSERTALARSRCSSSRRDRIVSKSSAARRCAMRPPWLGYVSVHSVNGAPVEISGIGCSAPRQAGSRSVAAQSGRQKRHKGISRP